MNNPLTSWQADDWALAICFACGAMLGTGIYLEYIEGLDPCPLCMMQRIWFVLTGAIAYASLLHNPRWGIYPVFSALAAAVGGYFSIKQLWLQSLPADQVPACGPNLDYMIEVFPLADILVAMTQGTGDCAEVAWSLVGISIPGWALLGFAALLVGSLLQLRVALTPPPDRA
jgi:disulfide bond formation protein DsbB